MTRKSKRLSDYRQRLSTMSRATLKTVSDYRL
nr:MAG TPA: hypothetical protein [Caudoviricetes sp.]